MKRRILLCCSVVLVIGSCRMHDIVVDPMPPMEMPESYEQKAGEDKAPDRWWEGFGDPVLNVTIDAALGGNLDLRAAWSRLGQVVAMARKQRAAYWPQLEAGMGVSRQRVYVDQPDLAAADLSGGIDDVPTKTVAKDVNNFQMTMMTAWEADLWGRIGSMNDAALQEHLAGREDLSALAMTIAAQVSETWFMLAEHKALLHLLEQQLATNQALLELVELRFTQGLATALDVRQQRQQISAMEAELPLVKGRFETLRTQLALLVGVTSQGELPLPEGTLPEPPAIPSAGLPLDLLTKRPDVRAARRRVMAADHRVGVAVADRFPALRLSGGIGFSDDEVDTFFLQWIYNLAVNFVGPIYDGGRRSAEVDRARAEVEEKLHGFGQTVLRALKEVEDALALERRQVEHLTALQRSVSQARETLVDARSRYVSGLTDYLPVLAAVQTLQVAERREVSGRRQRLSYRVQLHRALGGTWTSELMNPLAPIQEEEEEAE